MGTYRARYQIIRELREQYRLTQQQVWERAGIAQGTYQPMESERAFEDGREFKVENLIAVATVLRALLPDIAHDAPAAGISPWLSGILDRLKQDCAERDIRLHTPHLAFALVGSPDLALHRAIVAHGDIASIVVGLEEIVGKIAPSVMEFREFEWRDNPYVARALQYAATRDREALDSDVALAMLQLGLAKPGSDTVRWLHRRLGSEAFSRVLQFLQDCPPPEPRTPPFPQTTLE